MDRLGDLTKRPRDLAKRPDDSALREAIVRIDAAVCHTDRTIAPTDVAIARTEMAVARTHASFSQLPNARPSTLTALRNSSGREHVLPGMIAGIQTHGELFHWQRRCAPRLLIDRFRFLCE